MGLVDTTTGEVVDILDKDSAFHLAKRITRQSHTVNVETGALVELIAKALKGKAWVALGYGSWAELVEAQGWEFRPSTSTDRAALAQMFRESGMSFRAVGKLVGASRATVQRDTSGVTNVTPEDVTGTDGKTYPSTNAGEGTASAGQDPSPPPPEVEQSPAAPSDDPAEGQPPQPSAGSPAPAIALGLKQATNFFTTYRAHRIHEINDPQITRTAELLIELAQDWTRDFYDSEPTGLRVINGGEA